MMPTTTRKRKEHNEQDSNGNGGAEDVEGLGESLDVVEESSESSLRKKPRKEHWLRMLRSLEIYKAANNGSIEIPEISVDNQDTSLGAKGLEKLRRWCNNQLDHQRRVSFGYVGSGNLTEEKLTKLKKIGFKLAPSYDEMYERLASRVSDGKGAPNVDKDEDGELFAWVEEQKKLLALHSNGGSIPLSNDNIEKLISLGFKANHSVDGCNNKAHAGVLTSKKRGALPSKKVNADTNWEEMYMALVAHKDEHKTLHIPHDNSSLSELEKKIKNFIHRQREEYRKLQRGQPSKLTAQRLQRLHSLGLQLEPKNQFVSWADRMKSLREFVEKHGHCKPNRDQPLYSFVSNIRHFYVEKQAGRSSKGLTDERIVSSDGSIELHICIVFHLSSIHYFSYRMNF